MYNRGNKENVKAAGEWLRVMVSNNKGRTQLKYKVITEYFFSCTVL